MKHTLDGTNLSPYFIPIFKMNFHLMSWSLKWNLLISNKNRSFNKYFRTKSLPGYNQEEISNKHKFRKFLQNNLQKCQVPESPVDWGILDHEGYDSWVQCCPELGILLWGHCWNNWLNFNLGKGYSGDCHAIHATFLRVGNYLKIN